MQKKVFLGLLALVVIQAFVGCSTGVEMNNPELNKVSVATIASVPSASPKVTDGNSCIFTKDKLGKIKDYLKSKRYVEFKQVMINGSKSEGVLSKKEYNMKADLKSAVTYCDLDGVEYFDNDKSDSHFHKDKETGKWVEDSGTVRVVDWSITSFESAYDVVGYLQESRFPDINTKGSVITYETYELKEKAADSDLAGVEYDKLGNKTTTFIMKPSGEPVSYVVDVEFSVGDNAYYCTSAIYYTGFSNKSLKMPKRGSK